MSAILADMEDTSSISSSMSSFPDPTLKQQHTVSFEPPTTLLENSSRGVSFSERDSVIESIKWLRRHVPRCVITDLCDDALRHQRNEETKLTMPHAKSYSAALLFIDMSGFTKLSQMMDLESLSKCINAYFQKIVDEVTNHGGDILKFAGDAVFAEWRVAEGITERRQIKNEIEQCVYDASICGAAIVAKCSDYPVFDTKRGLQISTLNVHCGLAYGNMAGVHVGNDYNRREFVVLGETIDLVSKACDAATYGELMASPEAYEILQKGTSQRSMFVLSQTHQKSNKPILIAARYECYFPKRRRQLQRMGSRKIVLNSTQKKEFNVPFNKMKLKALKHLKKLLSFYVHPVVVSDEITRSVSQRFVKVDEEIYQSEAELRSVYTIFIKAITPAALSTDTTTNKENFLLLNNILDVVTSVLDGFKGHLRQFIVDDKGVILIATFGLRGSTSPNMASDRVLPASRTIHYALQNDLGVDNYIGTTLGQAYCGVVGGIKRHEYAVLGPPVNLAARLLSMPNHPGILINDEVRQEARKWGTFLSFPPMKAKGYAQPVLVYQPLMATEARWGKVNPMFVGRKEEIKEICTLAKKMAYRNGPAKMFFVWGESGSGKSDFLVQTTSIMRRLLLTTKKKVIVKGNIGNEGDSMIPFSLFRSILSDLLGGSDHAENRSVPRRSLFLSICRHLKIKSTLALAENASISSEHEDEAPSPLFESMSFSSTSSMNTARKHAAKRLNEIISQLGGSKAMAQAIRYHLGHTQKGFVNNEKISLTEIVDFMARVFLKCVSNAHLTVIALDDLHNSDSLSWQVIKKIYDNGENILVVCGSRPFGSKAFYGDDFWKCLTSVHKKDGRFQELNLGPLSRFEISKMASVVLGKKLEEVDRQFVKDIYDHTGGMPHYAFQAISNVKRRGILEKLDSNRFGWSSNIDKEMQFISLNELLLQRIDDLDDFTRKMLHMGSVLGHTFSLAEMITVSQKVLSIPTRKKLEHTKRIKSSLEIAVKEGILKERPIDEVDADFRLKHYSRDHLTRSTFKSIDMDDDDDDDDDDDNREMNYHFCHDSWRTKILSLLLDSYKRDIHMHAAKTIESEISSLIDTDNNKKMRLFGHLKGSGNTFEAAELALKLGDQFSNQGLYSNATYMYDKSLDMFRKIPPGTEGVESVQGFSIEDVKSLKGDELLIILKLLKALGKTFAISGRTEYAKKVFNDALEVYNNAPQNTQRSVHKIAQDLREMKIA